MQKSVSSFLKTDQHENSYQKKEEKNIPLRHSMTTHHVLTFVPCGTVLHTLTRVYTNT